MRIILILIFLFGYTASHTQETLQKTKSDSLLSKWQDDTLTDSIRISAYYNYIWNGFLFSRPDSADRLALKMIEFCRSHNNPKGESKGLNMQGISWAIRGDYSKAIDHYERSLKILEEIGHIKGTAGPLNNIGMMHRDQGNFTEAVDYYERSLKVDEEFGDQKGIAGTLNNIGSIYIALRELPKALDYLERSLKISENLGDQKGIAGTLNNIGNIYEKLGAYPNALDYLERSLKISEEIKDDGGIANSLSNIGIIYRLQNNYSKALDYFERCIKISEEIGNRREIANSLSNIGATYRNQGDINNSLKFHEGSLKLREEIKDKEGVSISLSNIGIIYYDQNNLLKAMDYFERSLKIREEFGDTNGKASLLKNIGEIYKSQENYLKALDYCKQSLVLAENSDIISNQKSACQCLYDTYKIMGNSNDALFYHEKIMVLDDSLKTEETAEKLQQMEFSKVILADSLKNEEEKLKVKIAHDFEINKKIRQRNVLIGSGLFVLLLALGFFRRWRYVKKSRDLISKEKDRSENLLLNILPAEIAEELKLKGSAEAKDFDQVSILFTDFIHFTQMSEKFSAKELVGEINYCFRAFDGICEKHGIEKIKTIGDSYMAAGGLPIPNHDSTKKIVLAALEMASFIIERKDEREKVGQLGFRMRAGVHTGNVVAGIVGVKKFQYDIWGDSVNTASRMESNGKEGKVNISQVTYELLRDDPELSFESRGKIKAKGKGEIEMYFVSKVG